MFSFSYGKIGRGMEDLKNRVGMVSSLQFFALCKYNCITNTYLIDAIYKVY